MAAKLKGVAKHLEADTGLDFSGDPTVRQGPPHAQAARERRPAMAASDGGAAMPEARRPTARRTNATSGGGARSVVREALAGSRLMHLSLLKTPTHDWEVDKTLYYTPITQSSTASPSKWASSLRSEPVQVKKMVDSSSEKRPRAAFAGALSHCPDLTDCGLVYTIASPSEERVRRAREAASSGGSLQSAGAWSVEGLAQSVGLEPGEVQRLLGMDVRSGKSRMSLGAGAGLGAGDLSSLLAARSLDASDTGDGSGDSDDSGVGALPQLPPTDDLEALTEWMVSAVGCATVEEGLAPEEEQRLIARCESVALLILSRRGSPSGAAVARGDAPAPVADRAADALAALFSLAESPAVSGKNAAADDAVRGLASMLSMLMVRSKSKRQGEAGGGGWGKVGSGRMRQSEAGSMASPGAAQQGQTSRSLGVAFDSFTARVTRVSMGGAEPPPPQPPSLALANLGGASVSGRHVHITEPGDAVPQNPSPHSLAAAVPASVSANEPLGSGPELHGIPEHATEPSSPSHASLMARHRLAHRPGFPSGAATPASHSSPPPVGLELPSDNEVLKPARDSSPRRSALRSPLRATLESSLPGGSVSRRYTAVGAADMWNPHALGASRPSTGTTWDYQVGVYNNETAEKVSAIVEIEEEQARRAAVRASLQLWPRQPSPSATRPERNNSKRRLESCNSCVSTATAATYRSMPSGIHLPRLQGVSSPVPDDFSGGAPAWQRVESGRRTLTPCPGHGGAVSSGRRTASPSARRGGGATPVPLPPAPLSLTTRMLDQLRAAAGPGDDPRERPRGGDAHADGGSSVGAGDSDDHSEVHLELEPVHSMLRPMSSSFVAQAPGDQAAIGEHELYTRSPRVSGALGGSNDGDNEGGASTQAWLADLRRASAGPGSHAATATMATSNARPDSTPMSPAHRRRAARLAKGKMLLETPRLVTESTLGTSIKFKSMMNDVRQFESALKASERVLYPLACRQVKTAGAM
ncbi:hypothetical protein FOA52_005332 [Chlamydomonas sp. UWO 241]|nr:hypothetical protein FOA52_005332 [Chlamydomonas sp. UWO 241]